MYVENIRKNPLTEQNCSILVRVVAGVTTNMIFCKFDICSGKYGSNLHVQICFQSIRDFLTEMSLSPNVRSNVFLHEIYVCK